MGALYASQLSLHSTSLPGCFRAPTIRGHQVLELVLLVQRQGLVVLQALVHGARGQDVAVVAGQVVHVLAGAGQGPAVLELEVPVVVPGAERCVGGDRGLAVCKPGG